jgi:regulator of nucleoside diphosphate kinase
MAKERILNRFDVDRIRGFLILATEGRSRKFDTLLQLKRDLATATVLEPRAIPPEVVTINSEVRISAVAVGGSTVVKIGFPHEAGMAQGHVSLLAPLGAALLGRAQGDRVTYTAPGGEIEVRILEIVYQPEAAGDFAS